MDVEIYPGLPIYNRILSPSPSSKIPRNSIPITLRPTKFHLSPRARSCQQYGLCNFQLFWMFRTDVLLVEGRVSYCEQAGTSQAPSLAVSRSPPDVPSRLTYLSLLLPLERSDLALSIRLNIAEHETPQPSRIRSRIFKEHGIKEKSLSQDDLSASSRSSVAKSKV